MVDHASLTGAALHEPKGVASAAAGDVYVADGIGSGAWDGIDYVTLPAGTVVNFAYTQSQTATSGTTAIPDDNTIPKSSEGFEVLSVSITPKLSTSCLKVDVQLTASEISNTAEMITGALFLNSETDARASVNIGANYGSPMGNNAALTYYMVSGSTDLKTFKVRIGPETTGSISLNKNYNGSTLGGTFVSSISVTEIKQ